MTRFSLLLFSTVILTGCAEFLAQVEEDARDKREAYFSELKHRCTQYGYKEGTEAFARCTQGEAQTDAARNERINQQKRNSACAQGYKMYCDTPPKRTDCTKDFYGNLHCETR